MTLEQPLAENWLKLIVQAFTHGYQDYWKYFDRSRIVWNGNDPRRGLPTYDRAGFRLQRPYEWKKLLLHEPCDIPLFEGVGLHSSKTLSEEDVASSSNPEYVSCCQQLELLRDFEPVWKGD